MGSTRLREIDVLDIEHLVGGVLVLARNVEVHDLGTKIVDGGVQIGDLRVHLQDLGVDSGDTRIDFGLPAFQFVEGLRVTLQRSLDRFERGSDVRDDGSGGNREVPPG